MTPGSRQGVIDMNTVFLCWLGVFFGHTLARSLVLSFARPGMD